ncbi:MAG: aerobic carbon-monoxide dehydrogenase large subunit [Nitrospinota bacterium]
MNQRAPIPCVEGLAADGFAGESQGKESSSPGNPAAQLAHPLCHGFATSCGRKENRVNRFDLLQKIVALCCRFSGRPIGVGIHLRGEEMVTRYFGAPILRTEDIRLLTGRGTYVDDVQLPGTLHGAVLRSPHAHARIRRIDASRALQIQGVELAWTADDLGELAKPLPLLIPHPSLEHPRTQVALARDKVRYGGEPVAFVVARDRYLAEDALEAIDVEYEPLAAVVDLESALGEESPKVHDDTPSNMAADFLQTVGDVEKAFAEADLIHKERFRIDRGSGQSMETRGVLAHYEPRTRNLTLWVSTQAPVPLRAGLAGLLGLPEHDVQVIAPDVGGGFGPKIMIFYPEEILVPLAAMRLGIPVKWIEDRREHFLASNQEREQIHDAEIALKNDGTILGVRTTFLHDCGAYVPYGLIVAIVTSTTLPGPYKLCNYQVRFRAVYTNKTTTSPYRGAGRPHAVFVMERLLDHAAEGLGMDPMEIRFRNFIQPEEFPYDVGMIYQDNAPVIYDSGDYPACLRRAMKMMDYEGFRKRRSERGDAGPAKTNGDEAGPRPKNGKYTGIGIACYVEGTGVGPYEGAKVLVEPNGKVFVATGIGSQGQSQETTFAQIAADQLGVDVEEVAVVPGDTRWFGWGIGTFASRTAVVAGSSVFLAAQAVREKVLKLASEALEAPPESLILESGNVFVEGTPSRSLTLAEMTRLANPLRGAQKPDFEPGLEATRFYKPPHASFANGVHGVIVEVDAETGMLEIKKYVVVHDCGRMINPTVVHGQVQGGVAQGIGGAFYEKLVYDEYGTLTTTNYMDYLLPTAMEVPDIESDHIESPSPLNPLGVKGAGEAGTIPGPALFAQAIEDALRPLGARISEMPLSPNRLRELIRRAEDAAK